jgi:Predicted acetyltransferase
MKTTDPMLETVPIEVVPAAPSQEGVIANLIQLYAHDFSEFHPIELGSDGRFGYEALPRYWSEPDRFPFLVKVNGRLAGFAFVKRGSEVSGNEAVWDVAEFFIVRSHRRRGIGMRVAQALWSRFPGAWEVRVLQANGAALNFWQRAIAAFAGEAIQSATIEKDGKGWHVFSFESRNAV